MSSQVPLDALILVLGFSIDAEVLAARPSPRLHWQASLSIITLASIHLQVLAQTTEQPDAGYSIFSSTLEYHANTIRSSLLMWMTWLPDFSLLSLDSNILQCFLPHRTSLCLPCLRSPPTKRAVNRNPTDEDNRNVYRERHSLYRNGNKMPSLRGKHTTTDQFSQEEAAWPDS